MSNEGFLQFNSKTQCPNTEADVFTFLRSLEGEIILDDEIVYKAHLKPEERRPYEEMMSTKRYLSGLNDRIPKRFLPEQQSYWDDLDYIVYFFGIFAAIATLFIVFYCVVRFIFRKCQGPEKIAKVKNTGHTIEQVIMKSWQALNDTEISVRKANMLSDINSYYLIPIVSLPNGYTESDLAFESFS